MTHLNSLRLSVAATAVLFATAFSVTVSATPLPEIEPDQIAQDSERRFNAHTGQAEIVAPTFDPFEGFEDLGGTVALRSSGENITRDGDVVRGGALLDLNLIYTTGSDNPYDLRGYEKIVYLSGEPVNTIRYEPNVLECSENVREVIYDETYYAGAPYGYVAGLYRPLPRYRGHRLFIDLGYGHYGYNYGRGFRGRSLRHNDRGNRMRDRNRDRRRDNADRDRDRDRNVRDTRRGNIHAGNRGADIRDMRLRGNDRDNRRTNREDRRQTEGRNDRVRTDRSNGRSDRSVRTRANTSTHRGGLDARIDRNVRATRGERNTRRAQPRKAPRATPQPRKDYSSAPSARPARAQARSERRNKNKAISRAVDKNFSQPKQKHNRNISKANQKRYFFPTMAGSYVTRNVNVSYRCVREESLTLHIPQERLDAARFDGFTLYAIDNTGGEVPIYIPPNYIEGFRIASHRLGESQGKVQVPNATGTTSLYENRVPNYSTHSGYNTPRIYGDPGSVPASPQGRYPQD